MTSLNATIWKFVLMGGKIDVLTPHGVSKARLGTMSDGGRSENLSY